MRFASFLLAGCVMSAQVHANQCVAVSPAHTTALVELYTSEGCDSCPPADRWLSGLAQRGFAPDKVVPIALHVDYWDYIGWKDPYGKRQFSGRQRKMAALARSAMVYTPQVLLQGQDFRQWGSAAFDSAVARINARPARARIQLSLDAATEGAFGVEATVELLESAPKAEPALYLAAYENRLVSAVSAGENRGRTLEHDYVVLEWAGPIEIRAGSRLRERRSLPLLPKAVRKNSGVAAFVQDRGTGEVLQALMLHACLR
jgi:hypothetical protein